MSKKVTLHSTERRVQIGAIDLTGEDVPLSVRSAYPLWWVSSLPASANRSTAFSRVGENHYIGNNANEAWEAAAGLVPDILQQMPMAFRKFMTRWMDKK